MIKFIHQEFSGLHQAAFLLGLSSLLSQLLALMRDRLLVSSFGTGINLDIYYAAFRIPDIIFASIASFVSVTVLIPFLIERLEEGEELKAKRFMSIVFSAFCVVMVVVSAVLFFFVPSLSKLVAPGFDPAARIQLIMLTRILLLSPFLLGLSNLLGSVTQAYKKFFVYALSPILYNVGIIIGIVFFFPYWGLSGLAYGVILGALMHLLIQIPAIYKTGLLPRFTSAWNWQELRQVIMISLPRTLALATDKISILILVALASLMATGAISIFNLSFNLQS
ncbi:MAG: lipid II flippase MurJ, partial [bacterium]